MKRDDGAVLTFGVLAVVAAAAEISRRRRGSGNDDDDVVEAQIVDYDPYASPQRPRATGAQLQTRHAAQARAQAALPDPQLARRAYFGGDMLDGLSFEEAVNADPRRIDGLITQEIAPLFGPASPYVSQMYERAASDLRRISGGRMTANALVGVMVGNDVIIARIAQMPRSSLRSMLPEIEERVGRAADIARRASSYARDPEDRRSWMELYEYFSEAPARIRQAISGRLPGPGRRAALEQL